MPLFCIKVRGGPTGPHLGPHVLEENGMYALGCHWSHEEEQKWSDFKVKNNMENSAPAFTVAVNTQVNFLGESSTVGAMDKMAFSDKFPAYNSEEKAFLKEEWGDEYHFLREQGLNIHKEEDREEGRNVLRAFMDMEKDNHMSFDPTPDYNDIEEEEYDDQWDPEGHQADYNFTQSQLEKMEKQFKNSEEFMLSYGLKFYDDDDLKTARVIAEKFYGA